MTAIAFDIPADIREIAAGLERFLRAEVIARHDKHADLLEDPRRRYGVDGRYVPEVVELIRQVRMASAEAGYFIRHAARDQHRRRHQRDPAPDDLPAAREGRPGALRAGRRRTA
jgi:hypothetical protein